MSWGKYSVLGASLLGLMTINSCGRNHAGDHYLNSNGLPGSEFPPGLTLVNGSARFGSQCVFGSFGSPQEVPLELWSCPLGLSNVELTESLQPLILQADCKKKTMDVRGVTRSLQSTTWEMMPDGSFYFSVDGGVAHFKDDGSGNKNCQIPLSVDMWGQVDCTDRDRAVIHVETIWWLGQSPHQAAGNPRPSPRPSTAGPSAPSYPSNPNPTNPGARPSPAPATTERPAPMPSAVPSPAHGPVHIYAPAGTGSRCNMPAGCYFHNITRIDQCT